MKPARSNAYLGYIRSHASCLWWEHPSEPLLEENVKTVAHHVRMGTNEGLGQKPSDFRCVPLTDEEHQRLHQIGERTFWENRGVDPYEIMSWLLFHWLAACGVAVVMPSNKSVLRFAELLAMVENLHFDV